MRVVIDANVLIAAYASRGLCEATVELCVSSHDIILTQQIVDDVVEKLIVKIKVPQTTASSVGAYLKNTATIVLATEVPASACRDRDDLNVLGAALAGEADCIITGDGDLLTLGAYEGIPIMSPRRYWEMLKKQN